MNKDELWVKGIITQVKKSELLTQFCGNKSELWDVDPQLFELCESQNCEI